MLDQTTQQVIEANKTKTEADKLVATAAAHEKGVAADHEHWQKSADAELENGRQALRDAFTAREKEVLTKEQKLLADLKEFKAMQADEDTKAEAFKDWKKSKEAELGKMQLQLSESIAQSEKNRAQYEVLQRQVQEKLDKIRSITTG
jgi:hypothetical protein